MKKLLMALVLMPVMALADKEIVNGVEWAYAINDGKAEVIRVIPRTTTGVVTIPSILGGCPVTSIGASAFLSCSGLTSVTIPSSVTSIGPYAFCGCTSLMTVNISDGVECIGARAFYYCSHLRSVTIPKSVRTIGESPFGACESLMTIAVGEGNSVYCSYDGILYDVERRMLVQCPAKKRGFALVAEGTRKICNYAFNQCRKLTEIMLPADLEEIGALAFADCGKLESISVDEQNVLYCSLDGVLYDHAQTTLIFCPRGKRGSLKIPEGVSNIGYDAFDRYYGSYYGIEGYENLTSIEFPASISGIRDLDFSAFEKLESISVAGGNVECSSENGLLYNKAKTEMLRCPVGKAGDVVIPNGVLTIAEDAFYGCNLTSVTIPASVTTIGTSAFSTCGVSSFFVNAGNDQYGSIDGALYGWNGMEMIRCPVGKAGELVIPEGVQRIAYGALKGCGDLTSISIPASMTDVDGTSFSECTQLSEILVANSNGCYSSIDGILYNKEKTNLLWCPISKEGAVVVPDGVSNFYSGFQGCDKVTSITIPKTVNTIYGSYFSGCRKLTTITVDANNPSYCSVEGVLYDRDRTTLIVCPEGKKGTITIPKSATSYASYGSNSSAFSDCAELTAIRVEDGNEIYSSFEGVLYDKTETKLLACPRGKSGSVKIPDGVIEIGPWSFVGCDKIESVFLPSSVAQICTVWSGNSYSSVAPSFLDCGSLKSISVDEGNKMFTSIDGVLYDKEVEHLLAFPAAKAGAVEVPEGVIDGVELFVNCKELVSVRLPSSITQIRTEWESSGNSYSTIQIPPAFWGCEKLQSISVDANNYLYSSKNGVLYNRDGTELLICPEGKEGLVVIDDGVLEIGPEAFEMCKKVKGVKIPSSVEDVGKSAFFGCSGLTSVTMPGRFSIRDVFPSSYDKIQEVTILNGEKNLSKTVFAGSSALTMVVISEGVMTLGEDLFYNFTNLKELTIPSTVTGIGCHALNGCSALKAIHVSNNGDIDALKKMLNESGFNDTGVTFERVVYCKVKFDPQEGIAEWTKTEIREGLAIRNFPAVTREGYEFLGWFTAAVGGMQVSAATVVTEDVAFYAQWQKAGGGEDKGEVVPYADAASVYDGCLYDGEKVVGLVQVTIAKSKVDKKTSALYAKVTATVQLAGLSKKLNFRGCASATGTVTEMTDKNGNKLAVAVGESGLGGTFRCAGDVVSYQIDGARNAFVGKSAADKAAASAAVRLYQGVYNVAFDGGTLSVSVDKKGKAKIAGSIEGNKVSATSQLVVGKDAASVPVVITKKVNVAFCLWVMADGTVEVHGADFVTSGEDVTSPLAGKAGVLKEGATFRTGGGFVQTALPGAFGEYLPNEVDVVPNGTRWIVAGGAKAGKVAFVKGGNTVDESRLGANPAGLKLSYKQKDGTFKGTFRVYGLEDNGKIKAYTANVTGVMIGAKGYGTATIKKPFVVIPIMVE